MLKKLKDRFYVVKIWLKQIFVYPELKLDKVDYDAYWRDKRGEGIGSLSDWQKERADYAVRLIKDGRDISICDGGSGDGSVLDYIRKNIGLKNGVGIDSSDFALDRLAKFGFQPVKGDLLKDGAKPIVTTKADYFLFFEILEHIYEPEVVLKTAFQNARRGVFFSIPNTGFFVYRLRLLFGKFPAQWRLNPSEHIRFWTIQDARWWLKSLGYSDYKIHFYKGVPILNKIYPALFAAGMVVYLPK